MRYRFAIFDFDGTLADSYPWFAARFNSLAERFGCRRVEPDELEQMRGLHTRQILARIGLPLWKLPALIAHVRREIGAEAAHIPLFDGIAPALGALHAAGVRLAVVSSNNESTVRQVLGEALAAQIDRYSCGSSIFGKAAHFRRVVKQLDAVPAQVLCIGDELRDLEAARTAGLDFAGVAWGYTRAESLAPHAKFLFGAPMEIVGAFA